MTTLAQMERQMSETVFPSWQDAAERWKAAYAAERALADEAMALAHVLAGYIGPDLLAKTEYRSVAARYRELRQQ